MTYRELVANMENFAMVPCLFHIFEIFRRFMSRTTASDCFDE
jgi:hypothetical protein